MRTEASLVMEGEAERRVADPPVVWRCAVDIVEAESVGVWRGERFPGRGGATVLNEHRTLNSDRLSNRNRSRLHSPDEQVERGVCRSAVDLTV